MPSTISFRIEPRVREQLAVMLAMQQDLNCLVLPDWAQRGLGWHRAIYVEAAEYLEHLGTWKWWKKGTPDFPQANMELVDIWHFGLSWYLQQGWASLVEHLMSVLCSLCNESPPVAAPDEIEPEKRHEQVDRLVTAAGQGRFDLTAFVTLLAYSGMDFDTLYQRYVGKNVLNRFRQEHGYKSGTYVKTWAGREDNQHLEELLEVLPADARLPEAVYLRLSERYDRLVRLRA